MNRSFSIVVASITGMIMMVGCGPGGSTANGQQPAAGSKVQEDVWQLFNHKNLDGWSQTNFGGEGDVSVSDGLLWMEMGYPLTGVTSTQRQLPKTDYEISLSAKRVDGTDFFCGLTFPVDDSFCSLIVGGWGGTLVGLSSIDGKDAAENDTKRHMNFDNDRWYKIRIIVRSNRIKVLIDDASVIDRDIQGCKMTIRNEVRPSRPLGICAFESRVALKEIQLKRLTAKAAKSGNTTTDRK